VPYVIDIIAGGRDPKRVKVCKAHSPSEGYRRLSWFGESGRRPSIPPHARGPLPDHRSPPRWPAGEGKQGKPLLDCSRARRGKRPAPEL